MYDMKAIYEADSVMEAIHLLQAHPEAEIIAGGSDILIKMREGRLAGKELVSIYGIDSLRGVSRDMNGMIRILPLTSFSHITRDPIITEFIPVLGQAVDTVGSPQIRNIGTIGGNTCNGVTSADSASTLWAFDAEMEITGPNGVKVVPIQSFYVGAGKTILAQNELLTAILIQEASYKEYFGCYLKYGLRNAMEIATTGCSVNVKLSSDKKTFADVRIGFGVAGPIPMRAAHTEEALKGAPVSAETIEGIDAVLMTDVTPRTSWRATKEFRQQIAKEMAKRALTKSTVLAGGAL